MAVNGLGSNDIVSIIAFDDRVEVVTPATKVHDKAAITRAIERICAAHDVSLPAAALQFVLAHPQAASVIVGLASPDEVRATMVNSATRVPDSLWNDLKTAGLLRADVPVPAKKE